MRPQSPLSMVTLIATLMAPCATLAAKRPTMRAALLSQPKRLPLTLTQYPALQRKTVGWGPGEQMTFSIGLGGIEAGRASLSIGKSRRAGREISVRGRGESNLPSLFALSEELLTHVDLAHMRPLRSFLTTQRGERITETRTRHRHRGLSEQRITRRMGQKVSLKQRRRRLPQGHLDLFSALLLLRSTSWDQGRRVELHVVSGRKSYRVHVAVKGHERVRTQGRMANCLRLQGVIRQISDEGRPLRHKPKTFTLWLSDDVARIPLRADLQSPWGQIKLQLESYRPCERALTVGLAL
ncbi:MAG: DUF3108 domain-containing protein [Deltaproteobacteria bacterium]|nr:DUF3108 domain-containing protein [Deltaproteobacteria bacterium]